MSKYKQLPTVEAYFMPVLFAECPYCNTVLEVYIENGDLDYLAEPLEIKQWCDCGESFYISKIQDKLRQE